MSVCLILYVQSVWIKDSVHISATIIIIMCRILSPSVMTQDVMHACGLSVCLLYTSIFVNITVCLSVCGNVCTLRNNKGSCLAVTTISIAVFTTMTRPTVSPPQRSFSQASSGSISVDPLTVPPTDRTHSPLVPSPRASSTTSSEYKNISTVRSGGATPPQQSSHYNHLRPSPSSTSSGDKTASVFTYSVICKSRV